MNLLTATEGTASTTAGHSLQLSNQRRSEMKVLAKNLTDEEKEKFVESFYTLWKANDLGDTDESSPAPWGCPWYWARGCIELEAKDIEEMAKNHFNDSKKEILSLKKEEEEKKQNEV